MEIMSQMDSKMKATEALTKIGGCLCSEAKQMSSFVSVFFFFRLCRMLLMILSISLE